MIRLKWIEKISQFIQQVVYHVWLLENEMYVVGENDLERSTSSKIQKKSLTHSVASLLRTVQSFICILYHFQVLIHLVHKVLVLKASKPVVDTTGSDLEFTLEIEFLY